MILVLGATTRNADEDGGDGSAAGITSRLEQEDGGANVVAVGGDDVCAVAGAVAVAVVVAAVAGVVGSMIPSSSSSSSSSSGGEGKVVAAAAAAAGAPPSASAGTLSPPFGTALSSGTVMTMGGGWSRGGLGSLLLVRCVDTDWLVEERRRTKKNVARTSAFLVSLSVFSLPPPSLSLSLPIFFPLAHRKVPSEERPPPSPLSLSLSPSPSSVVHTARATTTSPATAAAPLHRPRLKLHSFLPLSLSLSLSVRGGGEGSGGEGGGGAPVTLKKERGRRILAEKRAQTESNLESIGSPSGSGLLENVGSTSNLKST